jgi:hypothetical protein
MGELIDGAIQQAAQPGLHFMLLRIGGQEKGNSDGDRCGITDEPMGVPPSSVRLREP